MSKNIAGVKNKPDSILLYTSIALVVLGILTLASVSTSVSYKNFDSTFYFLRHQIQFGLIPGIILGFLVFKQNLEWIKKKAPIIFLFNLFLLFIVILPKLIGITKGTIRALDLGVFTVQPAEFLKLTIILYWASWWSSRQDKKIEESSNKNLSLLIFLIIISIVGFLMVSQPDVSTFGIIAIIAAIVYFSANSPFWHTPFLGLTGILAFILLMKADYRKNRLLVFFDPETDPMGVGYQLKQSLITIGSGGLTGVGIGFSQQKFGFLPELISDSIFSVFAEETGFIGSFILISLFALFIWRGFKIAYHSKNTFNQLTAIGISSWIVLQAFISISTMIGVIPLTGVPLPFISYGGSALISELIGVGLLLNISKESS
ncbi:MAG: putative peptidoglycan glycosyltransferase FtsW [Patescibacteria group bacterium]|nr:putative lipid II flippase FtsW [Patescibacteria group bacterium]MBU1877191.1 putative lipid II flippase FtsW [Patescibacteria group bacterium]